MTAMALVCYLLVAFLVYMLATEEAKKRGVPFARKDRLIAALGWFIILAFMVSERIAHWLVNSEETLQIPTSAGRQIPEGKDG